MDCAVTRIKGGKIIGLMKTEESAPAQKAEEEAAPPKKRTRKAAESGK